MSDLQQQFEEVEKICHAYLVGIRFIVWNTARDPKYWDNHLLSYTAQDFIQSAIALPLLTVQGIQNVCRRELRFILEMAIKLCFVQQQQYSSDIATKLNSFKAIFDSSSISIKNQVDLELLPGSTQNEFLQDVGRFYGETSNYVHLTTTQILERIRMVETGRTSGYENSGDTELLNKFIARGLALSLVYLLHSVPSYVVGDLLVEADGKTTDWFFTQSKYIALLDEYFDYKAERQSGLKDIQEQRQKTITF
jgi:hypothetical protein